MLREIGVPVSEKKKDLSDTEALILHYELMIQCHFFKVLLCPTLNPFLGPSITLGVALIFEELRLRKKEEMNKSKFTDTLNCNAMITQNSHLQAEKPTVSMWPNPFQIDFLRGWNGHLPRAGRDRKFHILWKTRKT